MTELAAITLSLGILATAGCDDGFEEIDTTLPVARDDSFSVPEDSRTDLPCTENDTNPGRIAITAEPKFGSVEYEEQDGDCVYRPWTGYHGPDEFIYSTFDGRSSARVTIEVTSDDAPFEQAAVIDPEEAEIIWTVDDLDMDGRPDVVKSNNTEVWVSFGTAEQYEFRSEVVFAGLELRGVAGATALVDDDVRPELVIAAGNQLLVMQNRDDFGNEFTPAVSVDGGAGAIEDVAVADVDGDFRDDIVALMRRPDSTLQLVVFVNQSPAGAIEFAAPIALDVPDLEAPGYVLAGRLDADANTDLFVGALDRVEAWVFVNSGNGDSAQFAAPQAHTFPASPEKVVLADLVGSDTDEIVWRDRFEIHVSRNTDATGVGFGTDFRLPTTGAADFVVADVDGDGLRDVLVVNSSHLEISYQRPLEELGFDRLVVDLNDVGMPAYPVIDDAFQLEAKRSAIVIQGEDHNHRPRTVYLFE